MVECDSLPMDQHLESTQIAVEALVVVLLCNCREVVHSPFLRDLRFRCVLPGGRRVEWSVIWMSTAA
jgi:hypothetical protein